MAIIGYFCCILLTAAFCNQMSSKTIEVADASQPFNQMMYLNREHSTMGIIVKENTLDDTAKVWTHVAIPPGKIGSLLRVDCFIDSTMFNYVPYKATKGRLIIEYYSREY